MSVKTSRSDYVRQRLDELSRSQAANPKVRRKGSKSKRREKDTDTELDWLVSVSTSADGELYGHRDSTDKPRNPIKVAGLVHISLSACACASASGSRSLPSGLATVPHRSPCI